MALGATATIPGAAFASSLHQGIECNPIQTDAAKVDYNDYGVHNTSMSASAQVWCGGATTAPTSQGRYVDIRVYDRNPSSDICCTARVQDVNGGTLSSAVNCSNSYAGGPMHILLHLATWSSGDGLFSLQCTLPPATSQGVSHVVSYRIVD